jgi:hypothetical protein
MPEVDKQMTFNAFHICMVVFVINLLINNNNYDYIINFVNYVINIETPGFWFIILHILLVYLILSNIQFELGFHAAIKFNL